MKKINFCLALLALFTACTFISFAAENTFIDVPQEHQYYESICFIKENKIASGYGNNDYRPENIITLNEFATMLCNAFDKSGLKAGPMPVAFTNNWIPMEVICKNPNEPIGRSAIYYALFTAGQVKTYNTENPFNIYSYYLDIAKALELCKEDAKWDDGITRGEVAYLMDVIINNKLNVEVPEKFKDFPIMSSTEQNFDACYFYLDKIPESILEYFKKDGWKIDFSDAKVAALNDKNGITAIGWCDYNNKSIYVTVPRSIMHEMGHYLDDIAGNDREFKEIYMKESSIYNEVYNNGHKVKNEAEYFAEIFEEYIMNYKENINMEEVLPETYIYMKNLEKNNWK